MKKYTKAEAIRIMADSAKKYETEMCEKQFLIAYEQCGKTCFCLTGFQAHNFKHFTGVLTPLPSKVFYERLLEGKLSPHDFEFDKKGNAHRKLSVLQYLPKLFHGHTLRGRFNNNGIYIEADYFIGDTAARLALAFRTSKKYDVPVSLYCEDVRKLTNNTVKIKAVWCKCFNEAVFTNNTYCTANTDASALLKQYYTK